MEIRRQILEGWLAASAALPTPAHLSGLPPVISFWGRLPRCPLPSISRTVRPPLCPVKSCDQPLWQCVYPARTEWHPGFVLWVTSSGSFNSGCWTQRLTEHACHELVELKLSKHGCLQRVESHEITHACRGPRKRAETPIPCNSV